MLSQNPAWEGGEGGEAPKDAAHDSGEAAQRVEEDDLAPDEVEIDEARAKQEEQANVDEITRAGDAPLSPAGPPRLGGSLADGALVGVADATEAARTLLKFGKVCRRLTRHVERQRVLPPAALIDTRFEGNMMVRPKAGHCLHVVWPVLGVFSRPLLGVFADHACPPGTGD